MSDERIHNEEIADEIAAMEADATIEEVELDIDQDVEPAEAEAEAEESLPEATEEVSVADTAVLPDLPPVKVTAATRPRAWAPAPAPLAPNSASMADRPDLTLQVPDPRRVTDYLSQRVGGVSERMWAAIIVGAMLMFDAWLRMAVSSIDPFVALLLAIGLGALVYIDERRLMLSFSIAAAMALLQLTSGTAFTLIDLAAALVFYRIARYGHAFARNSMLTIGAPLAALFLASMIQNINGHMASAAAFHAVFLSSSGSILFVIALAVFVGAWLAGSNARKRDASDMAREVAEVQRDVATATALAAVEERDAVAEIARLKQEQAALAHDVHDVVGHSLAVVLAQAESAAFLPDDDVPALRQAISNIEGAARTALKEVRQVLGAAATAGDEEVVGDALDLIESARTSGYEVTYAEHGTPIELSTGVATVAYRVLQELLTNAIKHGTREEPIQVVRQFTDDALVVRVTNRFDPKVTSALGVGSGHDGIRHRLLRTGGNLDLARTNDAPGVNRFIATATISY